MNVMLLSVSLWAGADSDPNSATRDLFHWLSALVALPCAAYAGMPFFTSAARALRARLAQHGRADLARRHARARPVGVSDHRPRARRLFRQRPDAADVPARRPHSRPAHAPPRARLRHQSDRDPRRPRASSSSKGAKRARRRSPRSIPATSCWCGAGERIAVDGDGRGRALGSRPEPRDRRDRADRRFRPAPRSTRARSTSPARCACGCEGSRRRTLLDEVNALLAKAIEQRSSYVRLADRAARLYAPVVHLTALATFLGWLALGAGWQHVAHRRDHRAHHHLPMRARARGAGGAGGGGGRAVPPRRDPQFRRGAGAARAKSDTIVFDKTGTLTQPRPALANGGRHRARGSRARRLARAGKQASARQGDRGRPARAKAPLTADEFPGQGVSALHRASA